MIGRIVFLHYLVLISSLVSGCLKPVIYGINKKPDLSNNSSNSTLNSAPVFKTWAAQLTPAYSGLIQNATSDDFNITIAKDNSGNTFIAGSTYGNLAGTNGGNTDAFVSKLDSSGNVLWIKQFIPSYSGLISSATGFEDDIKITEFNGSVYITGTTSSSLGGVLSGTSDVFVAKLDSTSGSLVWIKQLTPVYSGLITSATGVEISNGISMDSTGNIFITGATTSNFGGALSGSYDVFVAKLDGASGSLVWLKQLTPSYSGLINDASNIDYVASISLDTSNNIYITGNTLSDFASVNAGSYDAYVAKLDTSGNLIWIKQFTTLYSGLILSAANNELPTQISIDSSGNSYITGSTTSGFAGAYAGGGYDIFIAKLNASGALVWIKQLTPAYSGLILDASGYDVSSGISVDAAGNSYITGYSNGNLGAASGGSYDLFVGKLNASGALQWIKQMTTAFSPLVISAGSIDQGSSIVVDTVGNCYIAGYSNGSLFGFNAGSNDAIVIHIDSTGSF